MLGCFSRCDDARILQEAFLLLIHSIPLSAMIHLVFKSPPTLVTVTWHQSHLNLRRCFHTAEWCSCSCTHIVVWGQMDLLPLVLQICCCFSRFSRQLMSGSALTLLLQSPFLSIPSTLDSSPERQNCFFPPLFLVWRLKSVWCVCFFLRFPPKSLIYLVLVCSCSFGLPAASSLRYPDLSGADCVPETLFSFPRAPSKILRCCDESKERRYSFSTGWKQLSSQLLGSLS